MIQIETDSSEYKTSSDDNDDYDDYDDDNNTKDKFQWKKLKVNKPEPREQFKKILNEKCKNCICDDYAHDNNDNYNSFIQYFEQFIDSK